MALIPLKQMAFRFSRLTKRVRFALILLSAVAIAVAASLVVSGFMGQDDRKPITLALVGPLSGSDALVGQAMRQGALLRVDALNAAGGIANRPVVLKAFDDEGDPTKSLDIARRLARDGTVWAVLGQHPDTIGRASELYASKGIPVISTRPAVRPTEGPVNPWLFHLNFERLYEARFLANYVRNVVGEPTVAIVREDTEQAAMLAAQFDKILQRFGTKLVEQWTFKPGDTAPANLEPLARTVKEKMPTGAIVVLGGPVDSARMVVALRDASLRNLIVGPSDMATAAFRAEIVERARNQAPEAYGHGLLVSSPILFDTANERAQRFYGQYEKRFSAVPDAMSAMGYDGVDMIIDAIGKAVQAGAPDDRAGDAVRAHIAGHDRAEAAFQGNVGTWTFDARGAAGVPVMMATYNGLNPVAALTQLQPIREVGVSNFLEEVSRGRALYVNDRFMYKTDVIYTGVQLNEIRDLNPDRNEATLNLTVWFRYRGNFNPADVVFVNALKPIDLGRPYREERGEVTTYVAYRVEERFSLNFADVRHPHGSHIAGLSFRHRTLNRNNVMFVTDVLGMSLVDTGDFVKKVKATAAAEGGVAVDPGWGERLRGMLDGQSEGSTLLDQLRGKRVLAGSPGWRLSRAWISQDVVSVSTEGDPNYVGFGRPLPDFSRVDFGVVAVPDALAARDVIRRDFFVYFAIFGLVLAVFAAFMDRKERGQFWRIQTLFMRMASWPLLLMATGNIALDSAVENLPGSGIRIVEQAFDALWWIVPAILVSRTMERFLWTPLEIKSQRRIPNIVRGSSTLVVFGLAVCGIVAFVLKQPITSLLAASGLVGMVIGLAIQANIANVFSGIILNMERPFKIGDAIQITDVVKGEVIDMTWRTVRVRNAAGYTVAMPNAKVSEATVINFSSVERVFVRLEYHADPAYEPGFMSALLSSALRSVQGALPSPTGTAPFVRYDGTRNLNGQWLSKYNLCFWVQDHDASFSVPEHVWRSIYRTLAEKGIDPAPQSLIESSDAGAKARLAIAKDAQPVPA
ncbi:ABC transporter substrate-binding protein [Arenibaculum pallidiluteum]|uniref:ABC transporter substrate-binding protein n=1 Tax=Arenibaculum pallidiluteum TaxID=2812559 RepID=UPI001A95B68B|nr:ABC transporter substrate-binding protein [Arenibaculum pallidiluteum]